MVRLRDGSLVEMNQRAEILVSLTRRDTTIHLERGNIIVAFNWEHRNAINGYQRDWANDPHIFARQAECVRDNPLQLFDPARALVNEQTVRCLPLHGRRIGLDRIMIFDRRGINDVDLVGSAGERSIDVSAFHL